jgi:hypothetical protein
MDTQSIDIFRQARQIDPTLKVLPKHRAEISRRRIRPVRFSREALFSSMAAGQPVLFTDVPVPVEGAQKLGLRQAVFESLRSGFPRQQTFRVRQGRDGERRESLRVDELLRRWSGDRGLVNITDLHIRGSRLLRSIDCAALSDFNLLAGARDPVGAEEMLTMVVSSAGVFTDSHSDVPDGSNHCFVGKKLWLVWDTFEGIVRNLEDVERSGTDREQAAFSMSAFLSVPHSRWFVVEDGQTLFLPGHLTHKVITLADYIGVGSFFVMLPSYWRTLLRWTEHTPLWALNARPSQRLAQVDQITRRVIRKLKWLAGRPESEQVRWGVPHLVSAVHEWRQTAGPDCLSALNPESARLVRAALDFRSRTRKAAVPGKHKAAHSKNHSARAEQASA